MRHPSRDLGSQRKRELTSRLQLFQRDRKRVLLAIKSEDNNEAMDQFWLNHLKNLNKSIDMIQSVFALGEVNEPESASRDFRQSCLDFT